MSSIQQLIKEMKMEIFKNLILTTMLKAVIAFFIFDIIKSFLDVSYVFSYLFASLYFIVKLFREIRKINLKIYEDHNPEIREMLSTAIDNVNARNPVVIELFKEVLEKVKKVSSGTLIVPGSMLLMIIFIPILAIISFELSPVRVDALSQDTMIESLQKISYIRNIFTKKSNVDGEIIEEEISDDDIYGDRSIATLGDEEINIKLNLGFETDITKPREEEQDQVAFRDYPDDENTELVYDSATLNENIEESDLARQYNELIRDIN